MRSAALKPATPAAMPVSAQSAVQPSRMQAAVPTTQARSPAQPGTQGREKTESYYDTKSQVFSALIDTIDLSQLSRMAPDAAREEIRDIVNDIIAIKNFVMSIAEQESCLMTSATTYWATARWNRFFPATTSPISWSTVRAEPISKWTAYCRKPVSASVITSSF